MVYQWIGLKTIMTVYQWFSLKPTWTISPGLAIKPVAMVSPGLTSNPVVASVSRFGPQNRQLWFGNLGQKSS
jgi:hypothetical protein